MVYLGGGRRYRVSMVSSGVGFSHGAGKGLRDKCGENIELAIFEISEYFGSKENRNAVGIAISRVGDLAVSRLQVRMILSCFS